MSPEEPRPGLGTEAEHHAAYLDFYREETIGAVLAMSPEEQRTSRLASGWTPLELLVHLAHMEQRWFVWRFRGEDVGEPFGDWLDGSPDDGSRWAVDPGTDAETVAAGLRATGRRTSSLVRGTPLDAPAAQLHGSDPGLDLRWCCFHVLQEYARHAGHLDIVAELAR